MKSLGSIDELARLRSSLNSQPKPEVEIRVCSTGCRALGALEVCDALAGEREKGLRILRKDSHFHELESAWRDQVETTFRLGIDEVQDVFEELSGTFVPPDR